MDNNENVRFQLAYRKAERDKADLQYENQQLRGKITTLTTLLISLILLFMVAIFVNGS